VAVEDVQLENAKAQIATLQKQITELKAQLALLAKQAADAQAEANNAREELAKTKNTMTALQQASTQAATKVNPPPNNSGGNPAADVKVAALARARSNLASHLKSLMEARNTLADMEKEVAMGGRLNTSLAVAKQNVANLEQAVTRDQLEIARLGTE
jgi:hypothetical protein